MTECACCQNVTADPQRPASRESCTGCFLGDYSLGEIDFGGPSAPEYAQEDVSPHVLRNGHFAPPSPPDERQRVRELYSSIIERRGLITRYQYRVLKEINHDVKLSLDRFARLASTVCDAKISIVNFLDDKTQYTSSEIAPSRFLNHTPIPKPMSICGHTILRRSAEIFEIPDTLEDWRFRGKVLQSRYNFNDSLMSLEILIFGIMPVLPYGPTRAIILVLCVCWIMFQKSSLRPKKLLSRILRP
jgi:hypothetical protein